MRGKIGPDSLSLILISSLAVFVLFFLWNHIDGKLTAYQQQANLTSIVKPLLFMSLAVFLSKKDRIEPILMCAPMVLMSAIVGSERIAIFAYFICMFYALRVNGGLNLICILLTIYFSLKGSLFIFNTIEHSDGFIGESIEFLASVPQL